MSIYTHRLTIYSTVNINMSKQDNTPVETLIYNAALKELNRSDYKNSTKEIQKAWVMGWLISQLKMEHQYSYDLKRRIDHIIHSR